MQAYHALAGFLREHEEWAPRRRRPSGLPESLAAPVEKASALLCEEQGLAQQMRAVLPHVPKEERLQAAYELALPWAPSLVPGLPDCVQRFFAE